MKILNLCYIHIAILLWNIIVNNLNWLMAVEIYLSHLCVFLTYGNITELTTGCIVLNNIWWLDAIFRNFYLILIIFIILLILSFCFITLRLGKLAINFFSFNIMESVKIYDSLRLTYLLKCDKSKASLLLSIFISEQEWINDVSERLEKELEFLESNILRKTSHKNFSRRFLI